MTITISKKRKIDVSIGQKVIVNQPLSYVYKVVGIPNNRTLVCEYTGLTYDLIELKLGKNGKWTVFGVDVGVNFVVPDGAIGQNTSGFFID